MVMRLDLSENLEWNRVASRQLLPRGPGGRRRSPLQSPQNLRTLSEIARDDLVHETHRVHSGLTPQLRCPCQNSIQTPPVARAARSCGHVVPYEP
jgi:hypothetical protein